MKKKLKISFILDRNYINWYLYDLIKWCINSDRFNIICIIKNVDRENIFKKRTLIQKILYHLYNKGFFGIIHMIFWKYFNIIEAKYVRKYFNKYEDHFINYKSENFNLNIIKLNPENLPKNKKKYIYTYSSNDLQKIKNFELDFIINGSEKVLKGKILNVTKLGILSIHHGDNRKFRGGPGGFWETYYLEKYSGYIIQILTEKLDQGRVIFRSNFETKKTYLLNQINIAEQGNDGYKKVLNYVSEYGFFPEEEKNISYSNKIFKSPKFWNIFFYFCKISRYKK